MTRRHSQSRMRRRVARGWMRHGKSSSDILDLIVPLLRKVGPMNAGQLQKEILDGGEFYSVEKLNAILNEEDARDWRTRRLRRATGYPDGYFIAFDINAGRD